MKTIGLKATARVATGKKDSVASRVNETVPAVLYGGKEANEHINIVEKEFNKLIFTPDTYIVELDIDGKVQKAIIKAVQFHPVTDRVLHIDFLRVFDDKEVMVEIPITTTGFAEGIKQGGALSLLKRKVKVIGVPANIPETITIDVTPLTIGKSVKIGNLDFPELKFKDNPSVLILSITETRTSRMNKTKEAKEAKKA